MAGKPAPQKSYNVEPKARMRKAFTILTESGGTISKGQALVMAGYSKNTALEPAKVTESKGWKQLLEEYMPDEFLAQEHKKLFKAKRVQYLSFPKSMDDEEIIAHVEASGLRVLTVRESDKGKLAFYADDDSLARKGALDLAYKLKGYGQEQPAQANTTNNFFYQPNILAKIESFEDEVKKSIAHAPVRPSQKSVGEKRDEQ